MTSPVRVIFFASGDFAIPSLQALQQQSTITISAVVTKPDQLVGRAQELQPTPIKVAAQAMGLPVYESPLQLPAADLGVVVYYGVILPAAVLAQFPLGVLNLHPSLLPRWRGPSPIRSALLADDAQTGVTIMQLDEGMDTGPILEQMTVPISDDDTNITLEVSLSHLGATLLAECVTRYIAKQLLPQPQATEHVTISKFIQKSAGELTADLSSREIWNRYRALQPWPGTWFEVTGKQFKITSAHWSNGAMVCDQIQPAGKKPMALADFKRGYPTISFAHIV